jgi:hypothetical protein
LFRTHGRNDKTYGLLSTPGHLRDVTKSVELKCVFLDKEGTRDAGSLVDIEDVLPNDSTAHALFSVFEVGVVVRHFEPLAFTKNISNNFYHGHPTRLSRIPMQDTKQGKKNRNQFVTSYGVKGCIVGDLEKSTVEVDGQEVFLNHASLARSFGKRALINEGDGGAPLVSRTRALLGFVAGESDGEVLVVPAEDIASRNNLRFFAASTDKALRFVPRLQAAE